MAEPEGQPGKTHHIRCAVLETKYYIDTGQIHLSSFRRHLLLHCVVVADGSFIGVLILSCILNLYGFKCIIRREPDAWFMLVGILVKSSSLVLMSCSIWEGRQIIKIT